MRGQTNPWLARRWVPRVSPNCEVIDAVSRIGLIRNTKPTNEDLEWLEAALGKPAVEFANLLRLSNEGLVSLLCEFGLDLDGFVERPHARELLDKGLGLFKRLLGIVAVGRRECLKVDRVGIL